MRFTRSSVFSTILGCLVCWLVITTPATAATKDAPGDLDNRAVSLTLAPPSQAQDAASPPESPTVTGCPVTVLPSDGSASINERGPNSNFLAGRGVYLITAAEASANGLLSGTVPSAIGFRYSALPGVAATGSLKIYLQNTGDSTNTKSTTWTTAITGMTLVHDNAATTLPNTTAPFDIPFSGSGISSFTYTGGAVYVAFDWFWAGPATTTANVACNTQLVNGNKTGQGNTPPATVAATNFRPETRLTPSVATTLNDASLDSVNAYGAIPKDLAGPQALKAIVTNRGVNPLTNLPVHLTVSGVDSFSNTQTVPSLAACGGQATVTFAPFSASTPGSDSIIFDLEDDEVASNDSKTVPMDVTADRYSFKYPGTTGSGGVGFTGATAAFVGKFTTTFATSVTAVTLEFALASTQTYRVAIYADSGTGTPGALLYVDGADRTVPVAGPVTIPISPVPVGPGNFFVGIQQTSTTNASLSYDTEVPIRPGKFYLFFSGTWSDFSPLNNFKLNIGVVLDVCAGGPAVCDDNNPCTNDTCGSFCSLLTTKSCTTNADCTAGQGTCVPMGCVHTPVANGTTCSDGNICTLGDSCISGVCAAGPVADCNDNNPCTDDFCDPQLGCAYIVNSGPCDDGLYCTVGDHCAGGACATTPRDCNDNIPCTLDGCDDGVDRCVNDVTPCGEPGDVDFCAVPPSQMRAWWPLDETTGPTAREITNGNTGTHTNGPTPIAGQVAGALQFDGVNDYVIVADNPTLNFGASTGNGGGDLSIDAWIKSSDTSGIYSIVEKRVLAPSTTGYTMFLLDGTLAFQLADAAGGGGTCGGSPTSPCRNYGSGAVVANGSWMHVAVTVDRDQPAGGKFWVNGAMVATFDPTTKTGSLSNTAPLYIGRHASGSNVFPGAIDEVEIFGRELSQDDVSRIYSASARGKCKCVNPPSDMVSWYPADDCLPGDHIGPNNGTWTGLPFCSSDAKVGNGDLAPFSSSPPTFVTVPHNASLNFGTGDFSVDLWIKTGTSGPIIGKGIGTGPGWLLSVNASGQLQFSACDTSLCFVAAPANSSVNSNGWRLVGMTVSRGIGPNPSATITYYVDGQPDGTGFISSMTTMDSVENMLIGVSPGSLAPYFNGEMDEIEIFRRVLTAAEMKSIYDADTYGKCKCLDPLPKNMVAWWPLDEPAGTTSQDIIGGHTGNWTGNPVPGGGWVAGALDFGTSGTDYVSVPVPATSLLNFNTGNFSVDAWVYWRGGAGDQPIVERPAGAQGWNFVFSQKFVHAHLGNDGGSNLGAAPVNTWVHVALTVQQGATNGIKFYKNGVLQGSATPAQIYHFVGSSDLNIGRRFNGKIDELEIFNRVLQPSEISALYRAGHDGKCKEQRPAASADISIEKSLISGTPTGGSYVTFRVIVNNNGPSAASSILVKDLLPPGLIYVSSTLPFGWTYDPATGEIFAPSLSPQTSNLLTITAQLATCNMVTNCAKFIGSDVADTNSANDEACVSIQATTPCGVISGIKYRDANKNGINDSEPIVTNQTIRLRNSSKQFTFDTTDASGAYDFSALAADTYVVTEQLNPDEVMISPAAGRYKVKLPAGGTQSGRDFGNYTCPAPVTPVCTPPPKGMVAWWALDEPSGNLAYSIVGGHTGTHNSTPQHISGNVVRSLDFDGVNDWVQAGATCHKWEKLTLDAWIRLDSVPPINTAHSIVSWQQSNGSMYAFYVTTTATGTFLARRVCDCLTCIDDIAVGLAPLVAGPWYHVAYTQDLIAGHSHLYVNGSPSSDMLESSIACPCSPGNWRIADDAHLISRPNFSTPFDGAIDEVEVFERELSATEIAAISNAGTNGKCRPSKCALLKHKNFVYDQTIKSPLRICNRSGIVDTFHWSLAGLPSGGPGCTADGPTIFSPTAGTTIALKPGQCQTINVSVKKPESAPAGSKMCYQATVVPNSASECFSCKSTAGVSTKWHGVAPNEYIAVEEIPDGSAKNVTLTVTNLEADSHTINYQLEVIPADPLETNQRVRLNGLPPGTPVNGVLNIPAGTTANLPVLVSYDTSDALSFYDLVLSTDQASSFSVEAVEPLASIGLASVSADELPDACSIVLPSDDIVLQWGSHTDLTWTGGTCGLVFNVYRGTTARLTGSDYGTCFDTELTEPETSDASFPPVGSFHFYLVTGTNGQGEGSLGTNRGGTTRPNLSPCP